MEVLLLSILFSTICHNHSVLLCFLLRSDYQPVNTSCAQHVKTVWKKLTDGSNLFRFCIRDWRHWSYLTTECVPTQRSPCKELLCHRSFIISCLESVHCLPAGSTSDCDISARAVPRFSSVVVVLVCVTFECES